MFGLFHLNQDAAFLYKRTAREVAVTVLGIPMQKGVIRLVEKVQGLPEAALVAPEGRLETQQLGSVAKSVSHIQLPGFPPLDCHGERLVGSSQVTLGSESVAEVPPSPGAELVDPASLRRFLVWNEVGDEHGDLRKMDRLGRVTGCGGAALAAEELAEAPAREGAAGPDGGEAVLRSEGGEDLPKAGGLGSGARQGEVNGAEAEGEEAGLVEIEEPAAHGAARGADGDLVEKAAVLVLGPVQGEDAVQGRGVEVLVDQPVLP